jgi:catechol 2,3-dioxygenase-like lactoylglutathione lyase family enzyme
MRRVNGVHHITAIAGRAQENLDFYAGVLGMRLVKKSVNQDDPGTYHLFYADAEGHPGSDLTFFPWPGFAADEDPAHLGESLVLPPWLEDERPRIEEVLPVLTSPHPHVVLRPTSASSTSSSRRPIRPRRSSCCCTAPAATNRICCRSRGCCRPAPSS